LLPIELQLRPTAQFHIKSSAHSDTLVEVVFSQAMAKL
jgi:hypothetical protein